jgi:hypothetical protein
MSHIVDALGDPTKKWPHDRQPKKDEFTDGISWMAREIERLRAENKYLRVCLFHPIEVQRIDLVEQLRARLVKELYSGEG